MCVPRSPAIPRPHPMTSSVLGHGIFNDAGNGKNSRGHLVKATSLFIKGNHLVKKVM